MLRHVILTFALLLGCQTTKYQYVDNLRLLGVKQPTRSKHEKIARLTDAICDNNFLLPAVPQLQEALNAASHGFNVSYFLDVTSDSRIQQVYYVSSTCLVFMGDAYK